MRTFRRGKNTQEPIVGVILAAGAATRMGGPQKLLLTLGGEPLVRRTVRTIVASGVRSVHVVVGRDADLVRSALAGIDVRYVFNPAYADGIDTSFAAGIAAVDPGVAAIVFALADQPFVTSAMIERMIAAFANSHVDVVAARYGGVVAPPHVVARPIAARIATGRGGVRAYLAEHPERGQIIDFPAEALVDIDTPEDYARAQAMISP